VIAQMDELTLAAVRSDPSCADSWTARSTVLVKMNQPATAEAALERALALNPFNSWAEAQRGLRRIEEGRASEVLRPLDDIRFLYERTPVLRDHLAVQCRARILTSSFGDAPDTCEQWSVAGGDVALVHLTALYALRGESTKAAELASKLAAAKPPVTLATIRNADWQPFVASPAYAAQAESTLYRGLKLAGVPDR
jgi:tetratricopeptide (TPR) repeat protein